MDQREVNLYQVTTLKLNKEINPSMSIQQIIICKIKKTDTLPTQIRKNKLVSQIINLLRLLRVEFVAYLGR